jgi:hypothetical protein
MTIPCLTVALARKQAVLTGMAKALAESGEALVTDRDAVRVLLAKGYHTLDAAILAGEARMLAYQEIVAAEMAKS